MIASESYGLNRNKPPGRQYIWRKPREPLTSCTVQPSMERIIMWGCMRLEGVEECVRVHGRMDVIQYVNIHHN